LIISLAIAIFGIILSAVLASYPFMIFSVPNFSLAVFFGYKDVKNEKEAEKDIRE
jgi:hypothetical protein